MSATVLPFPSQDRQERISSRICLVHPIALGIFGKLFPPIRLDDLEQVGLLALILACDKYSPSLAVSFELYLRYCIRNAILDSVRKQISRHEHLYGLVHRASAETDAADSAASADLRRALASLTGRERRVIELRLEGRTLAEIARELGIAQRSAGKLETRAIETLRARMNPVKLARAA